MVSQTQNAQEKSTGPISIVGLGRVATFVYQSSVDFPKVSKHMLGRFTNTSSILNPLGQKDSSTGRVCMAGVGSSGRLMDIDVAFTSTGCVSPFVVAMGSVSEGVVSRASFSTVFVSTVFVSTGLVSRRVASTGDSSTVGDRGMATKAASLTSREIKGAAFMVSCVGNRHFSGSACVVNLLLRWGLASSNTEPANFRFVPITVGHTS